MITRLNFIIFSLLLILNSAHSQSLVERHFEYGMRKSNLDFTFDSCAVRENLFTSCLEAIYQVSNLFGRASELEYKFNTITLKGNKNKIFYSLENEKQKLKLRRERSKKFYTNHSKKELKLVTSELKTSLLNNIKINERNFAYKLLTESLMQELNNPYYGLRLISPGKPLRRAYGSGLKLISRFGQTFILDVLESSPAKLAGLKSGDRIIKINNINIENSHHELWSDTFSADSLKKVSLEVDRGGFRKNYYIKLGKLRGRKNSFSLKNKKAQIKLTGFKMGESCNFFKESIKKINRTGATSTTKLVIDLRNNYGGDLNEAICILDLFLPKRAMIGTSRRYSEVLKHYTSENDPVFYGVVQILVNELSISSSEIFASVMQYHKRAKIVGTKTYGKFSIGTLAMQYNFEELGSEMKGFDKIGHFHLPSGQTLEMKGVTPDIQTTLALKIRLSDFYLPTLDQI